jgi:hypothetical protein
MATIYNPNTKIDVVLRYMQLDLYFHGAMIGTQSVWPPIHAELARRHHRAPQRAPGGQRGQVVAGGRRGVAQRHRQERNRGGQARRQVPHAAQLRTMAAVQVLGVPELRALARAAAGRRAAENHLKLSLAVSDNLIDCFMPLVIFLIREILRFACIIC